MGNWKSYSLVLLLLQLAVLFVHAQECVDGVGPTCGPFPYTSTTQLNDQLSRLPFGPWPPEKQGYFTFAVEDPDTPAFVEPVSQYGFPWPYPTKSANGFSQTGYSVTYPAFWQEDAARATESNPWGLKSQWFRDEGQTPPKSNMRCAPGTFGVVIHQPGGIQYDIDVAVIAQKIVSYGWVYISSMGTPGELSILNTFVGSTYNVTRHILAQNRVNTLISALRQLQSMNRRDGNPLLATCEMDFDLTYYISESLGGVVPMCITSGCHSGGWNVNQQPWPRFDLVRNWDPSTDSYLDPTDFVRYHQPQITVLSQFAGGTWGMDFRQWAMTVVDSSNQVNSNIFTKGTAHEMGAATNGCQNSNIAVKYGFYQNVTYWYGNPGVSGSTVGAAGLAVNFWKFANQTAYRFCAPGALAGFTNPKYPQMPLSTLADLLHSIDLNATIPLRQRAQGQLRRNFQTSHWVNIQNRDFQGQTHFLYWDNDDVPRGNCTWDNSDSLQHDAMARENWNYLSYLSSSLAGANGFQDGGVAHNYQNCVRCPTPTTCAPCKFPCRTYQDDAGNSYLVPVQMHSN